MIRLRAMMVVGLVVLLAMGLVGYVGMHPRIGPDDVVLSGSVRPADPPACKSDIRWVLEVKLDHKSPAPLMGENYTHTVYAFDGRQPLFPQDYGMGCDNGSEVDGEGFTRSNYGPTYMPAVKLARQVGALPEDFSEHNFVGSGFGYRGDSFPITVRYYLTDQDLQSGRFLVVYSHHESRLGRNLNWVKSVRVEP